MTETLLLSSTLLWDHIKGFLVIVPVEEGQVQIRVNAHKWSLLLKVQRAPSD